MKSSLLTALVALALLTLPAAAQFENATVLGTARDASQTVIPGAIVKLTNVATAVSSQQTTDDSGSFQFLNIRAGRYTIRAEKSGFAAAELAEFVVTVGTRQRVDLTLQFASVSETVTISGQALQLETDSSARG